MSDAAAIAFMLIKPNLDASRRKAKSGKNGGTSKQTASKAEANGKQSGSNAEANGKQEQPASEKEKEKEREKENECYPPTPFSQIIASYSEHVRWGATIVMLIPARTDTSYFHECIYGKAEIRFLRGRLKFEDENGEAMNPAPFPSMVVIFR